MNRYIPFEIKIAKNKPNTIKNKDAACPFCDRNTLKEENDTHIEEDKKIIIKNKFPTFRNAFQTVYIEHDTCEEDLSTYSKETLYDVISFGIKHWLKMSENPDFKSATLIKNHGIHSGGSIHHPHMQIVGFADLDYKLSLKDDYFEGIIIQKDIGFEWNISTKPRTEFYEFNILLQKKEFLSYLNDHKNKSFIQFAEAIQKTVFYILNTLNPHFKSYNLAFYEHNEQIIVKIIPRGFGKGAVNSAFFLGYDFSQVPSNLEQIAAELKKSSHN